MFKNLRELVTSMPTEEACRRYLIEQRWNGKVTCPYCDYSGKIYTIENGKRFKCGSKECYKKFSVTVGTIMEASNIPLTKWLMGIYICLSHKKGISSYQLGRDLSIAQKNAWFMLHRIRHMVQVGKPVSLGEGSGIVEADETFVGGKYANMHNAKRKKLLEESSGNGFANKTTVLGMVERGGNLIAKVIPSKKSLEIGRTVAETVKKDSTLITDCGSVYYRISHQYNYQSVNHSISEYVRDNAHTNTIEGAFSHFKRMIYGTYHQISAKHTQRYCDEFAYRFNSRKIKDVERFNIATSSTEGRLTYKTLIDKKDEQEVVIALKKKPENRGCGLFQLKDGEIVGQFKCLREAARKTGIGRNGIRNCCRGKWTHAGGFDWIYA